ncbi:MAG: glycosyltransferase family 2 protein [Calditrichota bacterium]
MEISVVIPAYNEAESLPELLKQLSATLQPMNKVYEIIIIDDGSSDGTAELLRSLSSEYPNLKALIFRRNYGKSPALSEGFRVAKGKYVITMDGDLQDDPKEIPNLLAKIDEGYDLVSGWKKKRHDPLSKRLPSKLFNYIVSKAARLDLNDFNCGLKAYRNEVVKDLQVYGELHRFLPFLANAKGYRVTEIAVQHHPRIHGVSKFGARRYLNGAFDLMTVLFLTRFRTSPLHIFGTMGLISFMIGFLIEVYLITLWFMGEGIGKRPLFVWGIFMILMGIQFVGFGLIAEMISANQAENVRYTIREVIGGE